MTPPMNPVDRTGQKIQVVALGHLVIKAHAEEIPLAGSDFGFPFIDVQLLDAFWNLLDIQSIHY